MDCAPHQIPQSRTANDHENPYRVSRKSKTLPMITKSYEIVLKPANEIKFLRQIKVAIKHVIFIRWYWIFLRDLLVASITIGLPNPQSSDVYVT